MAETAPVTPVVVSIKTTARMIDSSPETVMYWIRSGKLPARKIGRAWRVRVEDIHALTGPAEPALAAGQ